MSEILPRPAGCARPWILRGPTGWARGAADSSRGFGVDSRSSRGSGGGTSDGAATSGSVIGSCGESWQGGCVTVLQRIAVRPRGVPSHRQRAVLALKTGRHRPGGARGGRAAATGAPLSEALSGQVVVRDSRPDRRPREPHAHARSSGKQESDCGPGRKRRKRHRRPTGHAPPLDSTRMLSVPSLPQTTRSPRLFLPANDPVSSRRLASRCAGLPPPSQLVQQGTKGHAGQRQQDRHGRIDRDDVGPHDLRRAVSVIPQPDQRQRRYHGPIEHVVQKPPGTPVWRGSSRAVPRTRDEARGTTGRG